MIGRASLLINTVVTIGIIGITLFAGVSELSAQKKVDGFKSYQLLVFCGESGNATATFWYNVPDDRNTGRPLMGLHSRCAGNCRGKTVSFEDALAGLPEGVSTAFKANLQEHEVKAAAGKARSVAGCGSKCDASKYDDYLRKRQVAMELFKHASDLRLTASKLVAEQWGAESKLFGTEAAKEVGGDLAWEQVEPAVTWHLEQRRGTLSQTWLARQARAGAAFAPKAWGAVGWIFEFTLAARRAIATAADYTDYQREAQEATKQAEEIWRKALADFEEFLKQKCSESKSVFPDEDRERLERAKAAIEEWDNNQNLYWDPIRNEAVTFSEAIRRANEYLKSGKISLLTNHKLVLAAFDGSDDPPDQKALKAAIDDLDIAIASWKVLSTSISKYLANQRSIERKLEAAFGVTGSSPARTKKKTGI